MKIAKVIPLYKKGNRYDPGNYRPVSILIVASKKFREDCVQTDVSVCVQEGFNFLEDLI